MSYVPIKIGISEKHVKRLLQGYSVQLTAAQIKNASTDVIVTKTIAKRLQKAALGGKGARLSLSNKLLRLNLQRGNGLFSSIKNALSKAYKYVAPKVADAAERLKPLAAEFSKNLAGKLVDKGEEIVAKKLNNVYDRAADKINSINKPQVVAAPRQAGRKPNFAPPPVGIPIPEFSNAEMKSNLKREIKKAVAEQSGEGFFSDVWEGFNSVIPVQSIAQKVVPGLVEKVITKKLGGRVQLSGVGRRKRGGALVMQSGQGVLNPGNTGGMVIPPGGRPVYY